MNLSDINVNKANMKLTKQQESEIMDVYEAFWGSLLNAAIDEYAAFLDVDFRLIGTTEQEVFFNKQAAVNFLASTAEQMAGNLERRKSKIDLEAIDSLILITEQFDAYVLIDNEWKFYGKTRVSSWMKQQPQGWKIVQQHFSFPDTKAEEGQTIGLENITKENIELREAIKRRTIELEHKNRDLEVEAALERVRALTMAMHNSEDVGKCIIKMFSELTALGVDEGTRFGIGILNHDNENNQLWTARKDGEEVNMHIGHLDMTWHPLLISARKAWKEQVALHKYVLEGEDLLNYYQMLNNAPDYKIQIPIEKLPKKEIQHCYIFEHGFFYAFSPREFQSELILITQRFSSLFEQTYRRYLDLVKAEEQAREAEIELALERVRARTMAMHSTEELKDVIQVVYDQFVGLNINVEHAGFILDYKEREDMLIWLADEHAIPFRVTLPYFDCAHWNSFRDAKEHGNYFFANLLGFEEKNQFYKDLFGFVPGVPEESLKYYLQCPGLAISTVLLENVGLYIENFSGIPYSDEENKILLRFGKVFQQTYTRFIDLQKVEAQAREARIETALERVRSRSLAMHKSDELNEVVAVLFEKFKELQIPFTAVGIAIGIEGSKDLNSFVCGENETGLVITNYRLPYFDHIIAKDFNNVLEKQLDFFVGHYSKVEKDSFYTYVIEHTPELRYLPGDIKRMVFESTTYTISMVAVKNALFAINDFEGKLLAESEIEIIKRFARVFDQAYTRFLDLQKAESQAREAQIEAALEKVRSRSLAMHRADELGEVVTVVVEKLRELDFPVNDGVALVTYVEGSKDLVEWMENPGFPSAIKFYQPYFEHAVLSDFWKAKNEGLDFVAPRYTAEENRSFLEHIFEYGDYKNTLQEVKDYCLAAHTYSYAVAFQKNSSIFINDYSGRSLSAAEIDILKRFSKVFEQAYIRFLDLQKAEAQTREAQIQLALERVRARTMAMKTQSDLLGVIELFGSQLLSLGVRVEYSSFINGTITKNRDWELWGYSPMSDEPPKKVIIPYIETSYFTKTAKNIDEFERTGNPIQVKSFTKQEKDAFNAHYWKFDPPVSDEAKNYLSATPGSMIIDAFFEEVTVSIVKFETEPYSEEQIDIFKRFSNEFRQTYIRFLDLQKAEAQAREAQIELALERVRARSMAMQKSEELQDTSLILFQQLKELGEPAEQCTIGIIKESEGVIEISATLHGNKIQRTFRQKLDESFVMTKMFKGWKDQQKTLVLVIKEEELQNYNQYRNELVGKEAFSVKLLPGDRWIIHIAYFSKGMLALSTNEPRPAESLQLLERFAKVFEQTYTRFLDLQKAEAQAREAKIEAALERVRSRSLAMHKTDELQEVVRVVAEELKNTGVILDTWGAVICTYFQDSKNVLHWTASEDPANPSIAFLLPYFKDELYDEAWASKNRGDSYFAKVFSFDVKNAFFKNAFEHSDYRQLPDDYKKLILESENHGIAWAWAKNSAIMIPSIQGDLPSEDEKEILIRFAKVFEQSFIRFLDLQKAEAQAKEAQIELSLERIRSQVTAMQESSDLLDIVVTMRTEFVKLGHEAHYFWHMRWLPERYDKAMTSGDGTKIGMVMTLPRHIHGDIPLVADWEKTKEPTVVLAMDVETAVDYVEKMITLGDFEQVDPQAPTLDDIRHIGGLTFVMARTTHGEIGYSLPGVVTNPPKDAVDTLVRFAGVFDLAYKRFEDLKAAERQNREAQIELALERVRARTMAMQHSDELADASQVLDQQVRALGIETWGSAFHIYADNAAGDYEWFSSANGNLPFYKTPREKFFLTFYEKGQQGEKLYVEEFKGETCKAHYDFLKTIPVMGDALKELEASGIPLPTYQIDHIAFFQHGYILFITYKPVPEAHDIFKRFAKVFEQTYTRFLDLQKSESQAKEAKIEAALERVRAQAMAMHHSDDLSKTIQVYFEQLDDLIDSAIVRCGAGLLNRENTIAEMSTASKNMEGMTYSVKGTIDMRGHPLLESTYDHWLNQQEHNYVLRGNEIREYYQYITNQVAIPERKEEDELHFYFPMFTEGSFYVVTNYEVPENELQIFRRFSTVLSLTYRRFNDLQKAEAQAREAKIEVALERTPTQRLLMKHSAELNELSKTFHEQLLLLGIDSEFSFVWLPNEEKNEHMFWATWVSEDAEGAQYHSRAINYPLDKTDPATAACYVAWESSEPVHETFVPPGEVDSFFAAWEELLIGAEKIRPEFFPDGIYYTEAYMKYGCFGIDIRRRLDADEKEIIRRFAVEFERTYTRFLDLKRAEAQAMEAIKRASVDRVRAEIASMRTTTDLERIQPLIWNELTTLGVPFIRCGVFIMMEEKHEVQAFLSTPDGKSIAAFHLPYQATEQTKQIVAHWQQKQIFKDHMDEKAFAEYTQNLVQQGAMASDEKYVTENRPTDLYLHFLPFLQGMLYVGNDAPLNDDELQLVQNLADAFSTAYARYEDFNKLEAAKAAVESAMGELKATQSQLVQQEKLASLGQLTAGIAHEIKNPLNFVNNFTEVSIELIEEALEEMLKHDNEKDTSLINHNLDDIKSNLKKVYDHGTRANSIVNSMLMHSRGGGGSPEPTPLNDFIREYSNLAFHGMRAGKNPVDVQMVLDLDEKVKDVPLIVEDFSRVVLNICNNAFDALRNTPKPMLTIRSQLKKSAILIQFEDNGPGIPEEIKDKILQPFFTTKKGTEGTGLGLSISNDIVKAHGGELKVEALPAEAAAQAGKEGQGSVFSIVLPFPGLKSGEIK